MSATRNNSALLIPDDEPLDFNLQTYINYRILGFSPRQASKKAGYKSEADYLKWEGDPEVQEALRQHIQSNRREALYTRDKVMEVIEEGIDVCRIQADGVGMIRGAQELNKMQGFYAPESKDINISVEHEVRLKQIGEMDEAELLEALDKEQPYIDAEFQELPDEL
jgi:hypothetical protein